MNSIWKRSLAMFLSIVMVFGMLPVNAFATDVECEHSYASEVTKEATCEDVGETTYTCGLCGDVYTEEISATGHAWGEGVATAATCTEDGYTTYTCGNCGTTKTEGIIAATGHDMVDGACTVCGEPEETEDDSTEESSEAPAECNCEVKCNEQLNSDCPVCGAGDITACTGKEHEVAPEVDEQVVAVQAMIDALPDVVYKSQLAELQPKFDAAAAAWGALTEEQRAQLVDAEKIWPTEIIDDTSVTYDNKIENIDDLKEFAQLVNGGNSFAGETVTLTADINMNYTAVVIGTKANPFKGTFDGGDNTISNLTIYENGSESDYLSDSDDYVGLFGFVSGGTIKNVTVHDPYIVGRSYVAGIVGCAYTGTVENCHVTGEIDIEGNYMVGGITGHGYAKIVDCSVIGEEGWDYNYVGAEYKESDLEGDNVGGIVGHHAEGSKISGCTVKNVTVEGTRKVGGIVGTAFQNNNISGCSVENVTVGTNASSDYASGNAGSMGIGGIVGLTSSDYTGGTISDCTVKSVTFSNENGVTVSTGAITGGHRGSSAPVEPTGTTIESVTVADTTGSNSYGIPEVTESYVAQVVGGEKYTDLQEAIVAAAPSGTVELLSDVTVDEWIMFSKTLSISSGQIITIDIDGLTIDGKNHTLTIMDIESAGNGNRLFYDATELNVQDLTIEYVDAAANLGGICLTSGEISNVTFIGGCGVFPGEGEITITGCDFRTNSYAIYYEEARDNLTVTGNTFTLADDLNVILLRGNTTFTNNIINSGRTVNVVSGSPVVTGNDFNDVRVKVYEAATATISKNEINNLVFENETVPTKSTFTENTLSVGAQAALDKVTAAAYVAKIGEQGYETFAAAMNAANAMNGEVTVEIYGEVEFVDGMELKNGGFTAINFKGMTDGAKITINQTAGGDYLEAHGKTVSFTDLILAKANPAWSGNAGHMGNYFSIQGGTVTYTNCTFPNGACTSTGTATYNSCTFENASEYGLWVYDDALVTVNGGTIDSKKGIKVYSEGEDSVTSTLTVKNATFTENVTAKPAVAIGYAQSITLIGNTYNNTTGVLELDSGSDADCNGITFVAQDAQGNDIASTLTAVDRSNSNAACGVLVDGKIYTTVAEAAKDAKAGSTVTLLHSSTETVELAEGVILNKNNYTADGVTVVQPVAQIGDKKYTSLDTAFAEAAEGETITLLADAKPTLTSQRAITNASTIDLGGKTLTLTEDDLYFGTTTFMNGTIVVAPAVKASTAVFWMFANETLIFDNVEIVATGVTGTYLIGINGGTGSAVKLINGSKITINNNAQAALSTVICDNGNGNSVVIENSTIDVDNIGGRFYLGGENGTITVKDSNIDLDGVKEGFYLRAGQKLSVEGTSNVDIDLNSNEGRYGINMEAASATYTKADTATVNGTVYKAPVKVTDKASLDAAIAAAQPGETITLTADIDYGTDQLKIEKAITLDLGGKTLTTRNAYGGMSIKNGPTIKNGTIVHASNTAAIKVWNAAAFEDLVIDVQGKGDANKTIGGIVLQSGTTTRVDSIKNVTIKGAALTNGIETYNCGDAAEPVIGSMENVIIDAVGTAMNISAPCGTATGCTFEGGENGIEIWIKGTYSASLTLEDCDVTGGVFAHDEFNSDPSTTNNGTLTLTVDDATTGVETEDITLTIARIGDSQIESDELIYVKQNAVAKIGDTYYLTLQAAIDAAVDGSVITLIKDVTEDVTITQKAGLDLTIDGAGKTFTGVMTVFGNGKSAERTETLTIKNINFKAKAGADSCIVSPDKTPASYSYSHNVTVEGCTFTDPDGTVDCAAIRHRDGGDENWTVTNCKVDNTMHSLLQVNNVEGKLKVWGCDVQSKNGLNLNSCTNVSIINNTINVQGYAIRAGVTTGGNLGVAKNYVVENNTLKSACDDGDAVIMLRASAVDMALNMEKNVVSGTTHISGTTNATTVTADANYWDGKNAPVVNGTAVSVASYYADEALTQLIENPKGTITYGYTDQTNIWGEASGNAKESFVIKVYAGDTLMATTNLNNVGGIIDGDVTVTWHNNFVGNFDEFWTTTWEAGYPNKETQPTTVKLFVDGQEVAENDVKMNGPDNVNPVVWKELDIFKPDLAQFNGEKYKTVAAALEAAKASGATDVTITLLGAPTKEEAAALKDRFDLYQENIFNSVTFKQEDATNPYYIYRLYTGSRTNGGKFVFDGVNIVVLDQYILEGKVALTNSSKIKSVAEANCFIFGGETTIEPGSKLDGVIEDFRGGDMIVDGGKTDGTYNTDPDVRDAIMIINWSGDSLTLKNGAYVNINSANEVGRLTINAGASVNLEASKLDACQWIKVDGTLSLDSKSQINTQKITGAGTIQINAADMKAGDVVDVNADLSGFTGKIEVVNNDLAAEINENGEIVLVAVVAKIGDKTFTTLTDAIAAAQDGETITLVSEATVASATIPAGNITIDLNGNDLILTPAIQSAAITVNGGLTVTGKGNVSVEPQMFMGMGFSVPAGGTLTIDNGTYALGENAIGSNLASVNGEIVINGGELKIGFNTGNNAKITITGGTFGNLPIEKRDNDTRTIAITGGTFPTEVPAEWLAKGYIAKEQGGMYTIVSDGNLYVNNTYNTNTPGYGTVCFTNYASAYAYATANNTKATIVVEKTNTLSGNTFDNNHKNYSGISVNVQDGAYMGNALSKWDMTYKVTVAPGGKLEMARPASGSVSNMHIKNALVIGEAGSEKKAYANFLSDTYQDGDMSIRYNGSVTLNNAEMTVQDLDAQGKLTATDSTITVDGAFASATGFFYPTTLTNSTMTVGGTLISGGLSDFAGGTTSQLGSTTLNDSHITIGADVKIAGAVKLNGQSSLTANNIDFNNRGSITINVTEDDFTEGKTQAIITAPNASEVIEKITVNATVAEGEIVEAVVENGAIVLTKYAPVAQIGETKYPSVKAALEAAVDGDVVTLISGDTVISMAGSVCGGKTVTITGNAIVDWTKGNLWVGREGEGDGKVIFDDATITSSVKKNPASTGIHVSGNKASDDKTNNGVLVIKNSNIELDYLINRNETVVEGNSTLTVYGGCYTHGRNAAESGGEAKTATLTIETGSTVNVINENGMGVGGESNGIMTVRGTYNANVLNVSSIGVVNVEGGSLDIDGSVVNNGTTNVSGESTLNVETLTGNTIKLLDGAIVKDSTVGGGVFVAGNVTFHGDNTFSMLTDFGTLTDYYGTTAPMKWTVEKGASVTLTDKARYGLGYGDEVTIYGSIEDAMKARDTLTDDDISLFMHGLVAQESSGWNCNSSLNVKDAYVVIGSNNSFGNKPGNYGGNYKIEIENSVVNASRITFYEANSKTEFTFNKSDVKTGTFMTRDADSIFTLTDTKLLSTTITNGTDEGNYNAGQLNLVRSQLTYSAPFDNKGTVTLGAGSSLTAPSITGNGKIVIDATGMKAGDIVAVHADLTGYTGTYEVIENPDLYAELNEEGKLVLKGRVYVAQIGENKKFETFAEALNAVQDGETITLIEGATGTAEQNAKIGFTKNIAFTITGKAPKYALPIITFQNATVNIKDAEILTAELDARQNATINVIDSKVYSAGGDGIVKSYYNGAINISGSSVVYTMQLTTMGYITVSDTAELNATWQTNVYGNGMITVKDDAVLATGGLNITGKDYNGRDNTDADRVGKPATIIVDGATLKAGDVQSSEGADYSYNADGYGINIGTIAGKSAVLDIKNGANVSLRMSGGKTVSVGADGKVNVADSSLRVITRGEGDVTLANNGTINVSGASEIVANKVTGAGWFYMNGVTLSKATRLLGAKVRFASGTNNIDGSTIDDGFFQVGIGAYNGTDANVDTVNGVTVNVKNAHIGANGSTYAGWIGTGFYDTDAEKAAAMTDAKYVLNIENSIAEFGYLHVSNDGDLNVTGNAAEKVWHNNSDYSFYSGNMIVNGTADFNDTDVLALYTNVSCDNGTDKPGTLNINAGTEYEAERHNGAVSGTNFEIRKTGVVNVEKGAELYIGDYTSIAADAKLNIGGTATALGTVTNNGTITLTDAQATLTTPEAPTVVSGLKDYNVVYEEGAYKLAPKDYVAEIIGGDKYESLAEALAAVGAGDVVIELLADAALDYKPDEAYGTAETASLTINGNGKTLTLNQKDSDWSSIGLANAEAKLVLNNMTIDKIGCGDTDGVWNTHSIIISNNVEMTDVTVNQSMTVENGATLNNVTINEANGYYGLYIAANGQTVTMTGGSITATNGGRGIKVIDQYADAPEQVTLTVDGTKFTTAEKAAVLVTSTAGAKITASNVDITGVAADTENFVWNDEERGLYYHGVKVYGDATKAQENEESFPIVVHKDSIEGTVRAYVKNLDELFTAKSAQIPLSSNYIDLRGNVVAEEKVDVSYDNNWHYTFGTSVEGGVTMDFKYADNWNFLPHFTLGEDITMNVPYLQVIGGDISIAGTINTNYLYLYGTGEGVTITETGIVNANVAADKTVQVKGGSVLTVNGVLNTGTLNVWTQDANNSELIVSGENAKVNATNLHAWNGKDGVSAQKVTIANGATLTATTFQADRGSEVTVDAATLTADKTILGYEGNTGIMKVLNNATITNTVTLGSVDSYVEGPEAMDVITTVAESVVVYEDGKHIVASKFVAQNVNTGKQYESVFTAMSEAKSGQTVELLRDCEETGYLVVPAGVTLELNGCVMTADYVIAIGQIQDSADEVGGIKAAKNSVILSNNVQMPLYDVDEGCYKFFAYQTAAAKNVSADEVNKTVKFSYAMRFTNSEAYTVLADHGLESGLTVGINLKWTNIGENTKNVYSYTDAHIKAYANKMLENVGTNKVATFDYTVTNLGVISGQSLTAELVVASAGSQSNAVKSYNVP